MKRYSVLAVLALVLVLGVTFVGCKTGVEDDPLNGTWVSSRSNDDTEWTFNNGAYTLKQGGVDLSRGTYSTSEGNLAITLTHFYCDPEYAVQLNTTVGWKTLNETRELFNQAFGMTDAEFNCVIDSYAKSGPYTITDNTLTWGDDSWGGPTYTRK